MAINSIVKWDNTPGLINNFIFETRMFGLGSSSYEKKVFSVYITATSSSSTTAIPIIISYRILSGGTSFTDIGLTIIYPSAQKTTRIPISPPVTCNHIQFQIRGIPNYPGDISISDISIIYRPLRTYSSTSGDSE